MKLDVKAFGLTCGILWGLGIFLMTWWMIAIEGAKPDPTFIGRIYLGYKITPGGSIVGLVWGLVDGLVSGLIFAWMYNLISARMSGAR